MDIGYQTSSVRLLYTYEYLTPSS